jgi:hypothetical protein
MSNCKEKEFKFVIGADNKYTYDISGTDAFFDETYEVTSAELIEMTEDLDDNLRQNAHRLEIEYVKVQLLGETGNSATSVTLTAYIDWTNGLMTDVDTLFTKISVPVTNSTDDYILVTDLTEATIDLLRSKLFNAVKLTDISPFTVGALGTVFNGDIEADLSIIVKASAVTSDTGELPWFILTDSE